MNKKRLLISAGLTFVFAMTIFMTNQGAVNAQECRIIRLHGTAAPDVTIDIEPKTLRISKGGCVIWSNWARASEVQIVFEEGKKCEDMTDSATGFKLDAHNCYVTSFVSIGSTSSLKFNEEGTFDYEVRAGVGIKEKGKIV